MAVMQVGKVRMDVGHRFVPVEVSVGFVHRIVGTVPVLVMRVVEMGVIVLYLFVGMPVLMALGQVQPDAERHRGRRQRQPDGHRFAEEPKPDDRANERRRGEISPGPRRAEMAQRQHEQDEAHAVS